jgi:hypothetical protein
MLSVICYVVCDMLCCKVICLPFPLMILTYDIPLRYSQGRGGLERRTPPAGYVCHRCKVPGMMMTNVKSLVMKNHAMLLLRSLHF